MTKASISVCALLTVDHIETGSANLRCTASCQSHSIQGPIFISTEILRASWEAELMEVDVYLQEESSVAKAFQSPPSFSNDEVAKSSHGAA